jgi:threonine dehydratase
MKDLEGAPHSRDNYGDELTDVNACSFIALHSIIHPRAITEFMYRYSSPNGSPSSGAVQLRAHIFLSFRLQAATPTSRHLEIKKLLEQMKNEGMRGTDISDDELAKGHLRYMIGGSSAVKDERLFRFGELLQKHGPEWKS